jgi:putative mRNA 3-end processing factor
LELQFLGGASEVGRSAVLLKGDRTLLLDYGVKLLDKKTTYPLPAPKIDAFILSHAHLDHSGNAPFLYKTDFPTTYGTEPTRELSQLLIDDSIKVGKKNHQPPKFSKQQLRNFMGRYAAHEFGSPINLWDYNVTFHDAGHICGSAITRIESAKTGKVLVYTGDFKVEPQSLQGGAELVKSDILLTESTYAKREHPERSGLIKKFIADIRSTIDIGGTALVPTFAVGRAQELLAIFQENKLSDYVYVDGMARKATEITTRYSNYLKNDDLLINAVRKSMNVESSDHRGDAVAGSSIILTTAGMLNGGPVLNYITRLGHNSKIFLSGYQMEGTNGRRLMEGKPLIIEGKKVPVRTPFEYYDFSAHAGRKDLIGYAKMSNPEEVFCMHGEEEDVDSLAEELKGEGFETHAPRIGDSFKLDF